MKFWKLLFFAIGFLPQFSFAASPSVTVDVVLTPMGDFKAKTSDVKGSALQNGSEFTASNIVVKLTSLKTGVELRDKHVQKHLQTDKFPEATLMNAKGHDGKGTGKIKIKGIEKDIAGTYKIEDNMLMAEFPLTISDFGIKDINYMGVGVEDEVKLHVNVPITKASALKPATAAKVPAATATKTPPAQK